MQETKDDILERANHMVFLCRNADTVANQTVITLADQREQLENIETHLVSIDGTLIVTKQNINRLKGITQRVIGTFRQKFHKKILSKMMMHSTRKQNSISSTPPRRRERSSKAIQPHTPPNNSIIDGKIDEALYQIDHLLHSLKDKAYMMNDQLVGQTEMLDHIQQRLIESTDHIQQQNTDMKKIIH